MLPPEPSFGTSSSEAKDKQLAVHGAYYSEPPPQRSTDVIVVRGPDLDSFLRPVFMPDQRIGSFAPTVPEELQGIRNCSYCAGDDTVLEYMESRPRIHPAMWGSFVSILIQFQTARGRSTEYRRCSGCLISPLFVFTAAHTFEPPENKMISSIQITHPAGGLGVPADIFDFDNEFDLDSVVDFNEFEIGRTAIPWSEDGLDFAVLKMRQPMPSPNGRYLKVPQGPPKWSAGSVLLCFGVTERSLGADPVKCFSRNFTRLLEDWDEDQKRACFEKLFDSAVYHHAIPLASFGAALLNSEVHHGYYSTATLSTIFGSSGGPVVSTERPWELVGLVSGAAAGTKAGIFLDCQTPIVKEVYRHCLASQE